MPANRIILLMHQWVVRRRYTENIGRLMLAIPICWGNIISYNLRILICHSPTL